MKNQLQDRLSLFVANVQTIKKGYSWNNVTTKRLVALLYTLVDKPVNCDSLKESHKFIKKQTGFTSYFRRNLSPYIAAMLSLTPQQEQQLADALAVYDLLRAQGLQASDYLVAAAYEIATNTENSRYQMIAQRTREFYDAMKAKHWFRTGQDDYLFAAMLSLTDMDVQVGTERMEQLQQRLKAEFSGGNSIQTLTQVLVLGDAAEDTLQGVFRLRDALRSRGIKLDRTNTLPSLGVLSLLASDVQTVADEVAQAQEFLRGQKGLGPLWIDTQELLLYVVSLICSVYVDEIKGGVLKATVSNSMTNLIIAQQTAMIAAATAGSVAAASSASYS